MTRTISLEMLREAGLSSDWMTVYVGWRRIPCCWFDDLDFEEVRDFAYANLGVRSPEEDFALMRIIDAAPEIDLALKELTEKSGISEETALSKWRLAIAKTIPLEPPPKREYGKSPLPGLSNEEYGKWDEELSWQGDFGRFARYVEKFAPNHPLPLLGMEITLEENIAALRQWIAEESDSLAQVEAGA